MLSMQGPWAPGGGAVPPTTITNRVPRRPTRLARFSPETANPTATGRAVDLLDRDPKTQVDPGEAGRARVDVVRQRDAAGRTCFKLHQEARPPAPNDSGDPDLRRPGRAAKEAEKTMTSPITLDLEGRAP